LSSHARPSWEAKTCNSEDARDGAQIRTAKVQSLYVDVIVWHVLCISFLSFLPEDFEDICEDVKLHINRSSTPCFGIQQLAALSIPRALGVAALKSIQELLLQPQIARQGRGIDVLPHRPCGRVQTDKH
jgi:hypothetical protein